MSWTEVLGTVTGLWCVWLIVREHVWTWPVGLLNNAFYLVLFWTSGLYADAGLQVVYAVIALYGWWQWLYGGEEGSTLKIQKTPLVQAVGTALAVLLGTGGLGWFLARYTPSTVPWMDAWTSALSLGAQYLQSRKYLEGWYLWILADLFYIGLYLQKDLVMTSGVYAVFLLLCIKGLRDWRKSLCAA